MITTSGTGHLFSCISHPCGLHCCSWPPPAGNSRIVLPMALTHAFIRFIHTIGMSKAQRLVFCMGKSIFDLLTRLIKLPGRMFYNLRYAQFIKKFWQILTKEYLNDKKNLMNFIKVMKILLLICVFASCNNKNFETNSEKIIEKTYVDNFLELNENKPEKIFSNEYYINRIIEFQRILPENRKINTITEINNIIPGFMSFLVGWNDFNVGRGEDYDIILENSPRGNFFGLYTFDKNQNIVNEYLVGYKNYLDSIRNVLLDELPGIMSRSR